MNATIRASLLAALGTGLVGLITFGMLHAWWIVPIWDRLLRGFPFAVVGALAVGWAYGAVLTTGRLPPRTSRAGSTFGLGAWLALLPATGASAILRLSGVHQTAASLGTGIELAVAGLTGFLIGRWLASGWTTTLAVVVGLEVLLAVQAGPVPIVNSERALGLFLLLAPLYVLCGAVHAGLTAWLSRRWPARAAT